MASVVINLPPLPINRLDSVSTIALLRAIPSASLTNGQDIAVDGGASVGDGLGGLFSWSELSVAEDDGYTIIRPDDVAPLSAGRWVLGNGGSVWRQSGTGTSVRSIADKLRERITPQDFGAIGDGVADDTVALQAWLNRAGQGTELVGQAGVYRITGPLTAPLVDFGCIRGAGMGSMFIIYDGASTNIDAMTIGNGTAVLKGWNVSGITFDSTVDMAGGCALRIRQVKNGSRFKEIGCGEIGVTPKLYNGIWFDNTNVTFFDDFDIMVKNNGIECSGKAGTDEGSDLFLGNGFILSGGPQVHCSGGFGGLNLTGKLLGYGGEVNLLIDESRVARGNREIFLSSAYTQDAANEAFIRINVPSNNLLIKSDAWLSGAGFFSGTGVGIDIISMPNGRFSINSGHIKNCKSHGIKVADATTEILIGDTTFITDNLGYGVFATVPTNNVRVYGRVEYNPGGNINANVRGYAVESVSGVTAGGSGGVFSAGIETIQQGSRLTIKGFVTCDTLGSSSGAVQIPISRPLRGNDVGFAVNQSTADHCIVRALDGNNYIAIQKDGGALPFTASGQTVNFRIEVQVNQ